MKIGKQGEIEFAGKPTYLSIMVRAFENNKSELAEKHFEGEIKVQPHMVINLWKAVNGEIDFLSLKSGVNFLKVKNKPEKNAIRLKFDRKNEDKLEASSSFLVFNSAVNRLKDEILKAVKEMKILSISQGSFYVLKSDDNLLLKNEGKELYLGDEQIEQLKKLIMQNYIISSPRVIEGRTYKIDENKNLVYRGVMIPEEMVKHLFVLVL